MAKFTFNGKTYNTDNRPKGMSAREYYASVTGDAKENYKKSSSSSSKTKSFDDYYDSKQQKKDRKASEKMFKTYYAQQINDSLEDFTAWAESEATNYNRVLRQGRAQMARLGGAIGNERTTQEGEQKQAYDRSVQNQQRVLERKVGSDNVKKAGLSSIYGNRVGTLTDEMNAAIEDQVLWYRDQALQKYNAKYGQSNSGSGFSFGGITL